MSANATAKNYLLSGPGDWDAFEHAYALKISAERVYHLGRLEDPSEFPIKRVRMPTRPEFDNYPIRQGIEGDSRATRSGSGVRTATISLDRPTATTYTDLSREDQEAYKVELNIYKSDLDLFNKEADGIRNVLNWMVEKVDPHYVETCSPATNNAEVYDNIAQFFSSLKAACGVNDAWRRKEARIHYNEVLKAAANGPKDWNEWITSWDKAIRIAQIRGVPETIHSSSWFEDTQQALDHHFNVFLRVERGQNKDKIEAGSYKPLDFTAEFKDEIKRKKVPKPSAARVAKGSFATITKSPSSENAKRSRSSTRDSREGSAKRPKPSIEGKAHCNLCERYHKLPNTAACWVAFPEKAPKNMYPSQKQRDLFTQRLEDKKEVRELFEQLQSKESTANEKDS
ncbi:retrotransposon hobase [Fusarium langsethiae]|uniref:Retrotransposon hobase n=1 Tax=Fusarium langsethiae TaxID=179993 RepID=A0A0M9EZ11_FUSLA|nr:retrotransposon hobase [Fusarium langsethiae]